MSSVNPYDPNMNRNKLNEDDKRKKGLIFVDQYYV